MENRNGFLLSTVKFGDNNAVIHVFTKEEGFQSFFLRGIYSAKNKKKAYLQPLIELNFSVSRTGQSSLANASRLELAENFSADNDIKSHSILFFVSDFLNFALRNEGINETLYQEIKQFRQSVLHANYTAHLVFLTKFFQYQGLAPLYNEGDFLNPEDGTFATSLVHKTFDHEISAIWKDILYESDGNEKKIPSNLRKKYLDSLMIYCQLHYPGFRTPVSLEVVQQIF